MMKRIIFFIVFVLLISIAFSACRVTTNNGSNSDNSIMDNTNEDIQTTMANNGPYSYDIDGYTLTIKTNINKYIQGDVFHFKELAHDLGWHSPLHEYDDVDTGECYYCGDNKDVRVSFSKLKLGKYGEILYNYEYSGGRYLTMKVQFARIDKDGVYSVGTGDPRCTVNFEQIIVAVYIMENMTYSHDDVLSEMQDQTDGYWYVNK